MSSWNHNLVVIASAQRHSMKLDPGFTTGLNSARGKQNVRTKSFSFPSFPLFGLNMVISVEFDYGKYRPEKTPYSDTFQVMKKVGNF